VLEQHQAQARHEGRSEEDSLDEDDDDDDDDDDEDFEGMAARLIDSCRFPVKPAPCHRARRLPRSYKAGNMKVARKRRHLAVCAGSHLMLMFRAGPTYPHAHLKPLVLATESRLPRRGR